MKKDLILERNRSYERLKRLQEEKIAVMKRYDKFIKEERQHGYNLNRAIEYYQINQLEKEKNVIFLTIECYSKFNEEIHYVAIIGKTDNLQKLIAYIESEYFTDFYSDCEGSLEVPHDIIDEEEIDDFIYDELDSVSVYSEIVSKEKLIEVMHNNFGIEKIREIRLD